ncbi:MAG: cadherin repeat domain-containing protein, partial [Myxococcota bacterium]
LGGDSATPTAPAVNAGVENSFILRIGAFENDDILVDQPGLDTHVAITMDEVGAVSGGAGYELQPGAGNSGTAVFDLTNSRTWLAATLALQPEATDRLTYAITGGNADGAFAIDPDSGEIRVADGSLLDHEATASRDLTIRVTDSTGANASATVTVDVRDVNEAPSVSGGPFSVAENSPDGTIVGSVVGSDPDAGGTLRYVIVGGDPGGVFTIDPVSGEIRVADGSGLDFETAPRFDLQVEVTDGGTPALAAVTTVTIDVSDGNDVPIVSGGPFALVENSPDGTLVGSVTGSDADPGDSLRFAIVGGDPNGAFAIDPVTGEIRVADGSQLDYDTTPGFDLQVEVRDDGSPPQASTAIVRVDLSGVNEAPIVSGGPFTIDENSANGTVVGRVSGMDPDAGDVVRYTIVAGDPNGTFALDANTGVITVQDASQLDFENRSAFLLLIEARDDASPALSTLTSVRVDVADVNEAPSASNAFFSLLEGSGVGTEAGTVQGSDPDAGDVLRYVIVDGNTNNAFAIDPATGEITVANPSALDFEANPLFRLQVAVIDDGNPSLASTVEVVVFVRKLLEIPPVGGDPDPTDPGSETETPPTVEDPAEEPPIEAPPIAQTDPTTARDLPDGLPDAREETTVELPAPGVRETLALASEDSRREAERWTAPELLRELTTELPLVDQVFAELRADFLGDLERVRQDVVAPQVFETALAGSSLSIAAGLSVGYALLLTRGGLLIASLVSSMPAWRLIDPLPVLSRLTLPLDLEDPSGGGESLGSMVRGGEAEAGAETPEGEISGQAGDR